MEESSIAGKMIAFIAKIWEVNPEIALDHCLIYSESIFAKTFPGVLKNMLDKVLKINFIKPHLLNSQSIF